MIDIDCNEHMIYNKGKKITNLSDHNLSDLECTKILSEISQLEALQILVLDLSKNKLTVIPQEISKLKNLSKLILSENFFSEFPSEILVLTSLTYLDMSGNKLTFLPQEISQLRHLSHLDLSRNELTVIPQEISRLEDLSKLILSENLFSIFPSEILDLTSLKYLDLGRNNIYYSQHKGEADSKSGNLQELNLSENNLSDIPEHILPYIKNITKLSLRRNNFGHFPLSILGLSKLLYLDLSENQLVFIPTEISDLTDLKEIYLCGNDFSSLPEGINDLKNLKTLSISGNELTNLQTLIGKLRYLNYLDLRGNRFSKFPPQILKLKKLENLYLGGNELSKIPKEISQLEALQKLDLEGNELAKFPENILNLANLTNLTDLDLSKNKLKNLPSDISKLVKLQNFYLRGNAFEDFPTVVLQLKKLQKLDLRENKLTNIPPEFVQLPNLTTLYLKGNLLKTCPIVISQTENQKGIDMSGYKGKAKGQYNILDNSFTYSLLENETLKQSENKAVILTAISEEYNAVRSHLTDLKEKQYKGTIYEVGQFVTDINNLWNIAIVETGMQNSTAAFEAERAIEHFKPNMILFVGVAGGIKDVKIGDVVAATKAYGYEHGKEAESFKTRPDAPESTYDLIQRARAIMKQKKWVYRIHDGYERIPDAYVGPIASGEKVVASTQSMTYELIRSRFNDAIAIDMESVGFLRATHANKEIMSIVIRGISDLLDGKSESEIEGSKELASINAAAFAFELISQHKLEDI